MSHHMGVKNHVCELCNKGFYRKEYLTSHMAQHSGIPGYTLEPSKKKRSPRSYKSYVKEEMVMDEDEGREDTEPVINSLHAVKFCMLFLSSADFFQNQLFRKILSGIPSEYQTVWIQIRPNMLSGLIWVQIVSKHYQQTTLVGKWAS